MELAEEKQLERKLAHFEGFTLDQGKRALFFKGERVRLTPKPLEALIYLVENRGRVTGKQEILDVVWKDTFVTEDVLVQAVKEVRRALKDDKDAPRFIQTVPRQGYRFVGEVSEEFQVDDQGRSKGTRATGVSNRHTRTVLSFPKVFAACLGMAAVAIPLWIFWKGQLRSTENLVADDNSGVAAISRPIEHLSTGAFPAGKPAFSPDGKLILYVGSSQEARGYGEVFIMPASGGNSIRVTEKANPSGDLPVFSPDGSHVVFSRPRGGTNESRLLDLYIAPSSGGVMRVFIPEASGAGFSPDGRWIAYTKYLPSRKALWFGPAVDIDEHREIVSDGFTPRWSPDGKFLAYTTSDPNGGTGDLWVVSTDFSAAPKNLTQEPQQIYGLTWTADSRSIIFSSKRTGPSLLWMISIDGTLLRHIVTDVGESAAPSAEPNGNSLVFHNVRVVTDLMLTDLFANNEPRQITNGEFHRWPRLSPSGEKVVSVMQQPDFGEHIYITDVRSGGSTRLSDDTARHPCWMDEGNVAYLSRGRDAQSTDVRVVNIASRVTATLTQFAGNASWLAINPNRRKAAVVLTNIDSSQKIILRDLDNNSDQIVAEESQYGSLRWLPDGSGLLWSGPAQASAPNSDGIWIYDMTTKQARRITPDGYGPVWDARSNGVFYSRSREFSGLWRLDPASGKSRKVRTWRELTAFDVAGSRLLFAQGEGRGQIYSVKLDR